jgi:hypothetical protein
VTCTSHSCWTQPGRTTLQAFERHIQLLWLLDFLSELAQLNTREGLPSRAVGAPGSFVPAVSF